MIFHILRYYIVHVIAWNNYEICHSHLLPTTIWGIQYADSEYDIINNPMCIYLLFTFRKYEQISNAYT